MTEKLRKNRLSYNFLIISYDSPMTSYDLLVFTSKIVEAKRHPGACQFTSRVCVRSWMVFLESPTLDQAFHNTTGSKIGKS